MKIIKYFFEFLFIFFFFIIFKIIGYKKASNLGEIIGKRFGPFFRSNRKIKRNLENSNIGNSEKDREIIINNTWNGSDNVIVKKKSNNEFKKFDNNKSLYSYQIEKISKNILDGNKRVEYPGMNFDETLLNMKIIDEWVNA